MTTIPVSLARSRLGYLDALRGLAAIYVVAFHTAFVPQPNLARPIWLVQLVEGGGSGVRLFFIVSCFSLFLTMPMRQAESRPLVSFFIHRFMRIAPLFYLWIVLSIVRDAVFFDYAPTVPKVLSSVFFVFNLIPGHQDGVVAAAWTIGVEMLFYALFPFLYARVKSLSAAIASVTAFLLLQIAVGLIALEVRVDPETKANFLQWFFVNSLPIFASGGVCFFAVRRAERLDEETRSTVGLCLLLVGLWLFWAQGAHWLPESWGPQQHFWEVLGYSFGVVGLALRPVKVFVNRVTEFFGKISYSVYLAHFTVIAFAKPVYQAIYAAKVPMGWAFISCVLISIVLTVPIAWVTYKLVEEPGVRLGKKLYRRFFAPAPAPAPVPAPALVTLS